MKEFDFKNPAIVSTGFLDSGGAADDAAFNYCITDVLERKIYLQDTMFWKLDSKQGVSFASIRNDIAILHNILHFKMIGAENNNYGRSEIESLKRDYGIQVHGFNTVGKITSQDIIKKGDSMDKHAIIRFVNSWRQNRLDDPQNQLKLGQIVLPEIVSGQLEKWLAQLDSFVRKEPEGIGATGQPKYGAEGSQHDDGIMSFLGNIHMIKTKIFNISGTRAVRNLPPVAKPQNLDEKPQLSGRAIGQIRNPYERNY